MDDDFQYQYHAQWTDCDGSGFAKAPRYINGVLQTPHPWDPNLKFNSREEAQAYVNAKNKSLEGDNPWGEHWKVRPAW
jgi:hypothetical protein